MNTIVAVRVCEVTITVEKIKFSAKDFFQKCDQIRSLVTFSEEALNGKLHIFGS